MQRMDTIPNFACVNIGQKNLPLTNDRMVQVYGSPSQIRDVVESVLVVVQERKHLLEGAYHDKYEPYPSLPLFQKLEIPKTLVSGALGVNYSKLDGIQKATGTSIHLVSEVNSEHKVCLLVYGQSKGPVDLAIARLFDVVKLEITRKMNEIVGRKYVAETVAPVSLVDYIIGERGKTVIQLSKKTNTAIDIHRGTGVCRVIGFDANTVSSATTLLEVTISRLKLEVLPYLSAIKPGYKYQFSNMVDIPTSSVKTIIGDRAKQIRKLETTLNVRVRFQDLVDQKRMLACVVYGDDLEHIERAMNAIATILSR
ncbi:hypothetical protein BABINDRAFT_13279 [Babjeviella inositovora NRRL Y-12698]|uniref:K Homology domain-containing protein n=1 Tax=Babjeviella inositovora NRRL Y-12698 TaxID=984486 RepID=A0A1E3QRX3_9ASCO|nr:uncharacterized protein BABINDRAFT_13279 [Babjeviella inositovora NRRL Y-12698]ODQ80431.1 hypothetical protein BABINDRAFT_13279 [Babjeviella inositovora NRRL Y-12698]